MPFIPALGDDPFGVGSGGLEKEVTGEPVNEFVVMKPLVKVEGLRVD